MLWRKTGRLKGEKMKKNKVLWIFMILISLTWISTAIHFLNQDTQKTLPAMNEHVKNTLDRWLQTWENVDVGNWDVDSCFKNFQKINKKKEYIIPKNIEKNNE